MEIKTRNNSAKHKQIYDTLYASIVAGEFSPSNKMPTEQELSKCFNASRPTVGKALQRLVKRGLIERRQGSGTFVKDNINTDREKQTIGVILPRTSFMSTRFRNMSSLFDQVLTEMSHVATSRNCYLIYNNLIAENSGQFVTNTRHICRQLIEKNVSGVLFFPLPIIEGHENVNREITQSFDEAGIAVTLLDRDIYGRPRRSSYDLVGSYHIDSGFILTEHLIKLGRKKILFLADTVKCSSTEGKIIGYKNSVKLHGITASNSGIYKFRSNSFADLEHTFARKEIADLIEQQKPDALVCMHDRMAAEVLQIISDELKMKVPEDISLVGFDDESFAAYTSVPLTTTRQPVNQIAETAIETLLSRIDNPAQPARNIQISTELIVRRSCGAQQRPPQ